jgi:hypothetical protein
MKQIDALTIALQEHGFTVKAYQGFRIYLNGYGRDISAYIVLDDPDEEAETGRLYDGCALKVFSNCNNQGAKWRINRAKQIKHTIMTSLYESGIVAYLGPICESWEDVIL